MSCTDCYTSIDFGEKYCTKCIAKSFCTLCDRHTDKVGPLRTQMGEKCCDECYTKSSTRTALKKENIEMETIGVIAENPTYLTDLINGWWSDGYRYYFAIQNQIYAADEIPTDYQEFKRAITFDNIDAELCGYIRGTTVIWSY
jgi:hypothetical protein